MFVCLDPPLPEHPCDAALCDGEAVAHALHLSPDWSRVEWPLVCRAHADLLRDAPCVLVPLGCLPPEPVLVSAIQSEILRRRPPQQVFTMRWSTSGFSTFANNGFVQWG